MALIFHLINKDRFNDICLSGLIAINDKHDSRNQPIMPIDHPTRSS